MVTIRYRADVFCLFGIFFFFVLQIFKFLHEGFQVFEFSVNRSKTNVSNVIERFEFIHDQNADMLGRNFAVQGILELCFDLRCNLFHLSCGNGTFVAGFDDAGKQLVSVENFMGVIFFYNDQRQTFHNFISGKSFLAG